MAVVRAVAATFLAIPIASGGVQQSWMEAAVGVEGLLGPQPQVRSALLTGGTGICMRSSPEGGGMRVPKFVASLFVSFIISLR